MSYQSKVEMELAARFLQPLTDKEIALLPQWEANGLSPTAAGVDIMRTRKARPAAIEPPPVPEKLDRRQRLRVIHLNDYEHDAVFRAIGRMIMDGSLAAGRCETLLHKLNHAKALDRAAKPKTDL